MNIPTRMSGEVTILEPMGKITIGVGDIALRETVHQTLEGGNNLILLNLREVRTIDASGIGELVSARTTVINRGGDLKLLHLPPKVQDILEMIKVIELDDELFNPRLHSFGPGSVFDDEDRAVASFAEESDEHDEPEHLSGPLGSDQRNTLGRQHF